MHNILQPLVTIGVPFFNSQHYVVETLESIKAQTYKKIQLILVDDCSTDESLHVVNDWLKSNGSSFTEVIVIKNPKNSGTSFCCKMMEQVAKGIFFSKLDSDDLIHPKKITTQVEYMIRHPDIALIYSNTLLIDSYGRLIEDDYFDVQKFSFVVNKIGPSGFVFDKLLIEDFIPNSSVLVRKMFMQNVGGYDKSLFTEDWDLWLRICKLYPVAFIDEYFSSYRIHSQSVMRKSSSLVKMYESCCEAVLKHGNISKIHDNIIAKHLYTYGIGMYCMGVINRRLLWKTFLYNRNLKSAFYCGCGFIGLKVNQKTRK